jgi:hypothetical protein
MLVSDRNAVKTSSMDFGSTASFVVGTEGTAGAATDWKMFALGKLLHSVVSMLYELRKRCMLMYH